MISEEIRYRLETDETFLRTSAVAVVRAMNRTFGITQEKLARDLDVSLASVARWIAGRRHLPRRRSCSAIIQLAERKNLPVEAIILGKDLSQLENQAESQRDRSWQDADPMVPAEVLDRLRSDERFLQTCAVAVIREMVQVFKFKLEGIASELGVSNRTFLDWLAERTPLSREEAWAILKLADHSYYVPVEAVIQGKVLGQLDPAKKVYWMRMFIAAAVERIDKDGSLDEHGERQVSLVVESGKLSFFDLGSWPGASKMSVQLALTDEELDATFQRIDSDEATLGGFFNYRLPQVPQALNVRTLPIYDPHFYHRGTINDWIEMTRWVIEGKVVDPNYRHQCFERWARRDLGLPVAS